MLKWLVTRGPSNPGPDQELLTDDPLATLKVKPKGGRGDTEDTYAVSRVNPIYEDEDVEISTGQQIRRSGSLDDEEAVITRRLTIDKHGDPESSSEDRTSIRSSGYGSKENDSVSNRSDPHDDELSGHESGDGDHGTPPSVPMAFCDIHLKTHQDGRYLKYTRQGDTPDSLSLERLKSISSGNLVNNSDFLNQNTLPLSTSVKINYSDNAIHQRQIRTLERLPRAQLQGSQNNSLPRGDISIIKENILYGASILNQDRKYVSSISNIGEEGDQTSRSVKQSFKTVTELRKSFEDVYKRSNQKIDIVSSNPNFVHTIDVGMRRARSLETLSPCYQHAKQHDSGTSTIPRPMWPKVSRLAENLEKEEIARDQKKRLDTSINGNGLLVSVPMGNVPKVNVLKSNSNYITSVNLGSQHIISRAKSFSEGFNEAQQDVTQITYEGHDWPQDDEADYASIAKYFGGERNGINFPLMSLQPDSLVTEDTLRMMRYANNKLELEHQDDIHTEEDENKDNESEHNDIPYVNRVMYTRGLYATLNRAASLQTKDFRKTPVRCHRSKSIAFNLPNRKSLAKKRGVNAVKGLWEKSGLKTNGRKLIIDVQDIIGEENSHDTLSRQGSNSSEEPITVHSQPRNLKSVLVRNSRRFVRLESSSTNASSRCVNTYEDINSLDRGYTSQVSLGTTESKSSATYEEVPNELYNGLDNQGFIDDEGRTYSKDNIEALTHFPTTPRYLNPSQLKEFQKKINAKLQSAPLHRLQWLDLDEIHVEETVDKQERRVTFTANTYIPRSLERSADCKSSPKTLQRCPGTPVRVNHPGTPHLRRHSEVMLNPGDLGNNAHISRNGSINRKGIYNGNDSMTKNGDLPKPQYQNGRWTMTETYQSRYQSICHDFKLDMRRSEKMKRRSQAKNLWRKCYAAILILMAVAVFIIVCVAISLYYSDGKG